MRFDHLRPQLTKENKGSMGPAQKRTSFHIDHSGPLLPTSLVSSDSNYVSENAPNPRYSSSRALSQQQRTASPSGNTQGYTLLPTESDVASDASEGRFDDDNEDEDEEGDGQLLRDEK
jgi:hypothetical protein